MLLKADQQAENKFSVPPKIKFNYENLKFVTETSTYRVYEAETRDFNTKHSIRILDRTKEFVKHHFDLAATLFVQELLWLQSRYPGSVFTNTFEIGENGTQIACATLPYLQMTSQFDENLKECQAMEKLISNVISDIAFLWKDLQLRNIVNALGTENFCYMKEKKGFFLGNWAKIIESSVPEKQDLTVSTAASENIRSGLLTSQDLNSEIKELAFTLLKMKGINYASIKKFQEMQDIEPEIYDFAVKKALGDAFKDSQRLQSLVERMLSLDPQKLPKLEELRIKEEGTSITPTPRLEESKQSIGGQQTDTTPSLLKTSFQIGLS